MFGCYFHAKKARNHFFLKIFIVARHFIIITTILIIVIIVINIIILNYNYNIIVGLKFLQSYICKQSLYL